MTINSRAPDRSAIVSARGIGITRQGRNLLYDVDIDLWPGQIVTLVGPNGAGKTTLVKALLGLERIDHGEIYRRPGTTIGYVPQRFDLDPALPLTVRRFLGLGSGVKTGDSRLAEILDEVGASRVIDSQLHLVSGGELQRILLARALLRRPGVLLLDEPAQGVDLVGEAELYDLISEIGQRYHMSILLVSHDLHTVMARSDRVICLNHHVCCSGVPDTVSKHPEYERLFGVRAAQSIAVYRHHHDHSHDLGGLPVDEDHRSSDEPDTGTEPDGETSKLGTTRD